MKMKATVLVDNYVCFQDQRRHLGPVGEEQREESIKALKTMKIAHLGVSHCTGMKTSSRLAQEWGDRFVFCSVGTVFQG
jgi:7,8-dihydropterin-6-yl-methyl-4-(beta-D-ribofuranosyl)aminobenzene 5'-phosphate synthase